jgi:hypothetical protein
VYFGGTAIAWTVAAAIFVAAGITVWAIQPIARNDGQLAGAAVTFDGSF